MISLYAIYTSNMLGVLLMFILFIGTKWHVVARRGVDKHLKGMMLIILLSCIADPFVFRVDSQPGIVNRLINILGNTWLFAANIISAYLWLAFLLKHLNHRMNTYHHIGICTMCGFGLLLLAVNFFYPIVFETDSANTYSRYPWYYFFIVVNGILLIDSLITYLYIRKQSGLLRCFPIWIYLIPIIIGVTLQTAFYGISVIWPCAAISVTGVILSVQSEASYIDNLTGVFNRAFLDSLKDTVFKRDNFNYTFLMIDINKFKTINDTLGHLMGDEALVETARIISGIIKDKGSVCRFGGDEFIAIINNRQNINIGKLISQIHKSFEKFNATRNKKYELSVSIGCVSDVDSFDSLVSIIEEADRRMYTDKKNS